MITVDFLLGLVTGILLSGLAVVIGVRVMGHVEREVGRQMREERLREKHERRRATEARPPEGDIP